MPKIKTWNETFWVIFKHCVYGQINLSHSIHMLSIQIDAKKLLVKNAKNSKLEMQHFCWFSNTMNLLCIESTFVFDDMTIIWFGQFQVFGEKFARGKMERQLYKRLTMLTSITFKRWETKYNFGNPGHIPHKNEIPIFSIFLFCSRCRIMADVRFWFWEILMMPSCPRIISCTQVITVKRLPEITQDLVST